MGIGWNWTGINLTKQSTEKREKQEILKQNQAPAGGRLFIVKCKQCEPLTLLFRSFLFVFSCAGAGNVWGARLCYGNVTCVQADAYFARNFLRLWNIVCMFHAIRLCKATRRLQ